MITLIKAWASIRVTVTKQGKIMERGVAAVLLGLWLSCGCTKAVCGEAQDITTEEARGTDICCSPIFDEEEASRLLELPEDRELVALSPIGYPAEAPTAPRRKTVDDLLSYQA